MSARIEDYALIGDCETAALVAMDGSIDWLCWPRFDSDACFAALLGTPDNGRWKIAPTDTAARISRCYRDDTLILETRFETPDGVARIIDFMPLRGSNSDLVRIVVGESGTVDMHGELIIRFGYGQDVPWVSRLADGGLQAIAGPDRIALHTPVEQHGEGLKTVCDFSVSAGDRVPFVLTYGESYLPPPQYVEAEEALVETEQFWAKWISNCETHGPWAKDIRRSLVTLKALTYQPTGGIVAAPTTSLPEQLGGTRNWDYRYCWLRDATLTLLALMNAGEYGEAKAWRDWLVRAAAGAPDQIQILYGIAGERRIAEWEVDWLPGYEGSRPLRIGNAAYDQLQIDVYGEVMDALHQARRGGLAPSDSAWALQQALLHHLKTIWREPDEGIWEVRGPRRHFTFSKVMAWVAFDRGIKGIEEFGVEGPLERWREIRDEIHEDVCENGFNPEMNSFVQWYGAKELDAMIRVTDATGGGGVSSPVSGESPGRKYLEARRDRLAAARRIEEEANTVLDEIEVPPDAPDHTMIEVPPTLPDFTIRADRFTFEGGEPTTGNGTGPIIYLDGQRVQGGLDRLDLDPSGIDRIEVVKGAAAERIFGAEAVGGVIQIFTKKGEEPST